MIKEPKAKLPKWYEYAQHIPLNKLMPSSAAEKYHVAAIAAIVNMLVEIVNDINQRPPNINNPTNALVLSSQ